MRQIVRYQTFFNGEKKGIFRFRTTLNVRAIRACAAKLSCGAGWGCVPILTPEQFLRLGGFRNPYGDYVPAGGNHHPLQVQVEENA